VQQLCRVQVLDCPDGLVDDVLAVLLGEDARPDHHVQVGLHELEDQVEVFVVACFYYV
jgi:hypothetical protein